MENVLIDLNTGQIKLINPLIQYHINDFISRSQTTSKTTKSTSLESTICFKLKDIELDYNRFAYLLAWFLLEFKFNFKQLLALKQADLIKMLHEQNLDDCTLELIKNCLNRNSITILEPLLIEFFTSNFKKLNESLNGNLKKKPANLVDELENDQLINNDNLNQLQINGKNSRLSDFVILSKLGQG